MEDWKTIIIFWGLVVIFGILGNSDFGAKLIKALWEFLEVMGLDKLLAAIGIILIIGAAFFGLIKAIKFAWYY